jgi:hypothetical protein
MHHRLNVSSRRESRDDGWKIKTTTVQKSSTYTPKLKQFRCGFDK